jgi:glucokinase
MTQSSLLIGDIGGTNARFALASPGEPGFRDAHTLLCADFASPEAAIECYLAEVGAPAPVAVCFAAAGPVINGDINITNNHWVLSSTELRDALDHVPVRLLNDFEAIAHSIPILPAADCAPIGLPEGRARPEGDFSIGILGPGTGLGVAGLYKRGGQLVPIVGEGGHIGFAPKSQVQIDLLGILRERYDRVSLERLLSGSGLANIYWALCRLHDEKRVQLDAAEIFAAAQQGEPRAAEAIRVFFEILGQVAGDLALLLGSTDGVYIAGGITKRYPELLESSGFRSAFENKGHHRPLLESIPTYLITHAEPGLLGAAHCASELVQRS